MLVGCEIVGRTESELDLAVRPWKAIALNPNASMCIRSLLKAWGLDAERVWV